MYTGRNYCEPGWIVYYIQVYSTFCIVIDVLVILIYSKRITYVFGCHIALADFVELSCPTRHFSFRYFFFRIIWFLNKRLEPDLPACNVTAGNWVYSLPSVQHFVWKYPLFV